jgi:hypothetical protein
MDVALLKHAKLAMNKFGADHLQTAYCRLQTLFDFFQAQKNGARRPRSSHLSVDQINSSEGVHHTH